MDSWPKTHVQTLLIRSFCWLLTVITFFLGGNRSYAQDEVIRLRFASMALRDQLPTIAEAKDYANATDKKAHLRNLIAGWLASPEHRNRMRRFFSDRFGSSPYLFLYENSFSLEQYRPGGTNREAPYDLGSQDQGVWYLKNSVKPSCTAVGSDTKTRQVNVWWSDSPVTMCTSAVSEQIVLNGGSTRCMDPFSSKGIQSHDCGCGKLGILCIPVELKPIQQKHVYQEVVDRAMYVYDNDISWQELLGGANFYGSRLLMHYYLLSDKVLIKGDVPSDADFAVLTSLPLVEPRWVGFPPGLLAQRSGIVTAPVFMKRFNNFRSRIRALSENLLCQDIDGSLNTSGISTFVNPSLSAFDRTHGERGECASCHFSMDNFGSTLLGWDDQGHFFGYNRWWQWQPPSQKGHVFGVDGEGPRFLMENLITGTPKFTPCMARQMWEDLTGSSFDALEPGEQTRLTQAAVHGPKPALQAVAQSEVFLDLRSRSLTAASAPGQSYDYSKDVMPILEKGCSGTSCHSDGNGRPSSVYLGQETRFKKAPVDRISNGSMPPPGSSLKISDGEREILVRFLSQ